MLASFQLQLIDTGAASQILAANGTPTLDFGVTNAGAFTFGAPVFLSGANGLTLGSGMLSTSGQVRLIRSDSATSGSPTNISTFMGITPGSASTATYNGLNSSAQHTTAFDTSGNITALRGESELKSTGTANQVTGMYGIAKASGNGGAYPYGSLYGGRFQAQVVGTRNFIHAMGIKIDGPLIPAATVDFVSGVYIQNMAANISGTGSATASVALFVEGSGPQNGIAWGNGASVVRANIYSPSANVLTFSASSGVNMTGPLTVGSATLLSTSVALNDDAGADTATLTNAPVAGNPSKWISINDNGVTRRIPAW